MKTYARIESGRVAELFSTEGDITEMFHPDIVWAEITVTTPQVGWSAVHDLGEWSFAAPQAPALSLDDLKTAATVKIDADADAIRRAVIGERATEYQTAYDEATAFKNGGYIGTVPPTVQAWVDAKAAGGVIWTAQQAADDILATAEQWLNAQYAIRANRLKAKEQVRAAVDAAGIDAALAEWAVFVTAIRSQLGVVL